MVKWLKGLLVSAMWATNNLLQPRDGGLADASRMEGELEPVRQKDEFDRWLHHDDVTQAEIDMLYSDDPEEMRKAEQAIFKRQEEFRQFWEDREFRRALMMQPFLDQMVPDKVRTPMSEKAGWGDDELPETFTARNFETGELEQIRFDDLPEWRI